MGTCFGKTYKIEKYNYDTHISQPVPKLIHQSDTSEFLNKMNISARFPQPPQT